jgi:hypothetical protein
MKFLMRRQSLLFLRIILIYIQRLIALLPGTVKFLLRVLSGIYNYQDGGLLPSLSLPGTGLEVKPDI